MSDIRGDFPYFSNKDAQIFFDSAASTQKPRVMIDALEDFYCNCYANIHRGIYKLSSRATEKFENARNAIAKFIGAENTNIVLTKNATEAINLVAESYARKVLKKGDKVLVSIMEHHSNILPWQRICKEKGAELLVVGLDENGNIDFDDFEKKLSKKLKIVAITNMSNVTGCVVDIKKVVKLAKSVNSAVLIDACQAIAHMKIDVSKLNCDFLVFSSHKLYGPTGVGVLYAKYDLLCEMQPYQTGGSMVNNVNFNESSFLLPPNKFEAGTPAIAEVIAFGEVIKYLENLDIFSLWQKEADISKYIRFSIAEMKNYKILYNCHSSIISIIHDKIHHSDISEFLNISSIAVRSGHHCAQPLMFALGVSGATRISIGIYNNMDDAEKLISSLHKLNTVF